MGFIQLAQQLQPYRLNAFNFVDKESRLGDYAGFAQQYLEEDHPGLTAMFLMGCGGDQMSAEDAAALVAMARRLVDRNPVPQGQMRQRRRDSHWSGSAGRELRTATYLTFWTDYVNKVTHRGLDWVEGRTPEPRSYFTTASPIRGASLSASFARSSG